MPSVVISTVGPAIVLVKWLKDEYTKLRDKKELYEHLFGFLKEAEVSVGEINPWIRDNVPPDDREALTTLKSVIYKFFKEEREEEWIGTFRPVDKNQNICSVGGPVSHQDTRKAMGYDESGKIKATDLPYVFNIQKEELEFPDVRVKRVFGGKIWYEPNWCIVDAHTKEPIYVPEVTDDGILKTDFLMIIVGPNKFTKTAIHSGKKHMMIAGAHGVANLAVSKVLRDLKILQKLDSEVKTGYFQLIVEIKIKWSRLRKSYIPKGSPRICTIEELKVT